MIFGERFDDSGIESPLTQHRTIAPGKREPPRQPRERISARGSAARQPPEIEPAHGDLVARRGKLTPPDSGRTLASMPVDENESEWPTRKDRVDEKLLSLIILNSHRKIIEEVAKYANGHEKETGHLPKILIFAVNDLPHTSHADQLVKTYRAVFNQGDDFVKKITGNANVDRPLQRIREFRNRPKARAKKVFADLSRVAAEINEAVAAFCHTLRHDGVDYELPC